MQRAVSLVSLVVLGLAWTLQAVPVIPEPLILTQENFDLGRFMGKWYELAVVSTCPHYMQRKSENPVLFALELQHVASEDNFTMMVSRFRNGSCMNFSIDHGLTSTAGQFFYHVSWLGADVDAFVLHTNYDEYAMLLLLSIQKPSGKKSTILKLYSRTMNVEAAVMDNFKTLVRQHGMTADAIIMNKNKDECDPVEQVANPVITQPQVKKNLWILHKRRAPVIFDQGERSCGITEDHVVTLLMH